MDRELYTPRSWTCDPDRCRPAGQTKPELAARMIARFLDAGDRVSWVAGDEVYSGNPKLRSVLEECKVGSVLAVACSAEVTTGAGKFRAVTEDGPAVSGEREDNDAVAGATYKGWVGLCTHSPAVVVQLTSSTTTGGVSTRLPEVTPGSRHMINVEESAVTATLLRISLGRAG